MQVVLDTDRYSVRHYIIEELRRQEVNVGAGSDEKENESIIINDNIEITVVDVQGEQVRIGINAPKSISIYRKEIYLEYRLKTKRLRKLRMWI